MGSHDERGSVYGSGVMLAEIPLLGPGERHPLTFYTRHGDCFGWSCVALTLTWAVLKLLKILRARRFTGKL